MAVLSRGIRNKTDFTAVECIHFCIMIGIFFAGRFFTGSSVLCDSGTVVVVLGMSLVSSRDEKYDTGGQNLR